jgi:hypothetical protein
LSGFLEAMGAVLKGDFGRQKWVEIGQKPGKTGKNGQFWQKIARNLWKSGIFG